MAKISRRYANAVALKTRETSNAVITKPLGALVRSKVYGMKAPHLGLGRGRQRNAALPTKAKASFIIRPRYGSTVALALPNGKRGASLPPIERIEPVSRWHYREPNVKVKLRLHGKLATQYVIKNNPIMTKQEDR